jgi:biotin carboxyl carrier protein
MERVDTELRHPEDAPERDLPGRSATDAALWGQFADATTTDAFCRAWLALQCRAIRGVVGALVLIGPPDRGPFSPVAVWPNARHNLKHLTDSAERALRERRGLLARGEANGSGAARGSERFEIAYPLEVDRRLHGVVVLDVTDRPEPDLQAALRQLHWGTGWLETLFRREAAARGAAARDRLQTVLDLVATTAGQERFAGAASALVSALATRLGCDRVSLGVVRGGRAHVRALSHSAQFGKQTSLMRAIGAAMDEALDQGAVIVYPASPDGAARVIRAHGELVREHGAGAICSVPLEDARRHVGVLTLERPAERPFDAATVDLCQGLAGLAGPLLEALRREDRWLATKAVDSLGTLAAKLVGPRHVAAKVLVLALIGAAVFLATARGDYRVAAPTTLEPTARRALVAPFSAYVAEAETRAGDVVAKGQVLCALDDREMRLERLRWLAQHEQLVKQYRAAMAAHKAADATIVSAQIEQAAAQLALLDDQLARTRLRAPFDAIVVAGDLSQSLGAPVERGQVLFEVAPLDRYRVVLQVDERDVADVRVGQRGTLVLSGFPTMALPFTVEKLTPVAAAREGRNAFRVEARLEHTPERLRPGLEGVSKIEIDRRRVVWIWTHQAVDWVRLTLWSWLP